MKDNLVMTLFLGAARTLKKRAEGMKFAISCHIEKSFMDMSSRLASKLILSA